MHIQTETIESLCNDSYRFLKFHMIGVIKKNMLFHTLHEPTHYEIIFIHKIFFFINFYETVKNLCQK
jgi:hypothetical protein